MSYERIAITQDLLEEEPKAAQVAPQQAKTEPRQQQAPQSTREADIERLITQLESHRIDLTATHADWVKLGFAFADLGENGRDYYHRISSMYSGYDRAECDEQFTKCLKSYDGSTRIESFFQYCKEAGQELRNPQSQGNGSPKQPQYHQPKPLQPPPEQQEPTPEDLAKLLLDATIDFAEDLAPPPVCLEVEQNGNTSIVATRGEVSLVIGKAKSRKTFFITIALAAAVVNGNVLGLFKGTLPKANSMVLFFDTEQGRYHVQKAARRVLHLSGNPAPSNFKAYGLRKYKPQLRMQIIEQTIANTPNLGMVVIDGVRDLVSSINDEEQATMLSSKLLKWSEEYGIHIMCVLHQNKGDTNPRGHLGTELQNKAETVLSITKDSKNKEISIVEAEYCRERDFEPFAFEIDSFGMPQIVEGWMPKRNTDTKKSYLPADYPISTHCNVLKAAFEGEEKMIRSQLLLSLKYALGKNGISIGDNKTKDFLTYYVQEQMITQHGKSGTKNSHYKLGS